MGKNRFVVNPFGHLPLSEFDKSKLKEFAYNFFDQSVQKYEAFISDGGPKVDPKEWKLIKNKDDTRVYMERDPPIRTSLSGSVSDHPALLMTGITWGTVEDCMYDLQMEQRKVSFCGLCLQQARTMSPLEVIKDVMQTSNKDSHATSTSCGTIDSSYVSSTSSEYYPSSQSEYQSTG
ncbi:hypothetical protein PRNP1_004576 [Phytophthora ramorum]